MASQYVENPVQVNVGSLDLAVSCALFLLTFFGFNWFVNCINNEHFTSLHNMITLVFA
jgi:hypothetical protein